MPSPITSENMNNTVVVPLFSRPEMFEIWCEVLSKVKGAEDQFYIFCLDYNYNRAHDRLIEQFPYNHGQIHAPRTNYRVAKQSYNVLNGLLIGARYSQNLVYYIEEDVFIGRDFFRFHEEVHSQQKEIFCSIATRNNNTQYKTDGRLEHYYLSDRPDYQALGVCFKKDILERLVAPHFCEEYFKNPVGYCLHRFPSSAIGHFFVEQDGLIRRVLEEAKLQVAFPHVPRAFHGGIYGYNRRDDNILRMNPAQRKDRIREIAFDRDKLKKYVKHPEFYQDSEPVDLETDFVYLRPVPALDK